MSSVFSEKTDGRKRNFFSEKFDANAFDNGKDKLYNDSKEMQPRGNAAVRETKGEKERI